MCVLLAVEGQILGRSRELCLLFYCIESDVGKKIGLLCDIFSLITSACPFSPTPEFIALRPGWRFYSDDVSFPFVSACLLSKADVSQCAPRKINTIKRDNESQLG